MISISRDKLKKKGINRFINSFKFSWQGIKYAYRNEQSLIIHAWITLLVIIFGFIFKISALEWVLSFIFIGLVLATELINTALEALVDLVTEDYHPLAKVAKDTASGAVLVFAITAAICGFIIFIPRIVEFIYKII